MAWFRCKFHKKEKSGIFVVDNSLFDISACESWTTPLGVSLKKKGTFGIYEPNGGTVVSNTPFIWFYVPGGDSVNAIKNTTPSPANYDDFDPTSVVQLGMQISTNPNATGAYWKIGFTLSGTTPTNRFTNNASRYETRDIEGNTTYTIVYLTEPIYATSNSSQDTDKPIYTIKGE